MCYHPRMSSRFLASHRRAGLLSALLLALSGGSSVMAQTETTNADRWLAALPASPEFLAPASRAAWENSAPKSARASPSCSGNSRRDRRDPT